MSQKSIKLILLGEAFSGKTSICQFYKNGQSNNLETPTIGVCYSQFQVNIKNNYNITLDVWDTSGSEKYQSLVKIYYQYTNIVFLIFDVGNEQSYQKVSFWMNELEELVDKNKILLVLIGNKCDIQENQRQISQMQAKNFAQENDMLYFETSCITGQGIVEAFTSSVQQYVIRYKT
ncbi:Ras family protein, putative [Ichthyophthirius multifiliis]|uniref:Ras family protein, putative n=1 Tax=Ichthyophthirius multifiliis TaxID=5932 RepID=G0R479_ICHMU|nr:Ras family protein, putative [Ichthyophthirius multifiliis]EGR27726.1 Ras family protein, putative [Ichthyophthirius multifiliis]|eukprot:XP_004025178.1 Ras family protein, putative [Ichthyophthirius multifiliis]